MISQGATNPSLNIDTTALINQYTKLYHAIKIVKNCGIIIHQGLLRIESFIDDMSGSQGLPQCISTIY